MKSRAETKESISRKCLAARVRRRNNMYKAFASAGAACAAALFLWIQFAWGTPDDMTDKVTTAGYTESGAITESPNKRSDPQNRGGFDAMSSFPDSVRIYVDSACDTGVTLSQADKRERKTIGTICDAISHIETSEIILRDLPPDATYVIEQTYGDTVLTTYLCGNRIRFDDGNWLSVSQEDAAELRKKLEKAMGKK